MKLGDWNLQSKRLEGTLQEFERIRFGFARQREWTTECLRYDSSSSSTDFYLNAFVLPRFIPSDFVDISYGFGWAILTTSGVRLLLNWSTK